MGEQVSYSTAPLRACYECGKPVSHALRCDACRVPPEILVRPNKWRCTRCNTGWSVSILPAPEFRYMEDALARTVRAEIAAHVAQHHQEALGARSARTPSAIAGDTPEVNT